MSFGSQDGKSGGFGSKSSSFGANSSKKNGSGFSSNSKSYFGQTGNGTTEKSGFGTNTTTGFGRTTTQQPNATKGSTYDSMNNTSSQSNTTKQSNTPNMTINQKSKVVSLPLIRGKISQYRTYSDKSGNYRRLFPRKIYQAIVYGQRLEDFLHSFTLTETQGVDRAGNPITQKYVVNVHGTANYGATLLDNEEVEVKGKFTNDNILMAREVHVINGSVATPIKFQRSTKAIAIFSLVILGLILLICGLFSGGTSAAAGVMNTIRGFLTTMLTVYVLLLILYFVSLFTRIGFMTRLLSGGRKRTSPLITMLIIAFILSLLIYNVFGIGTMFGNAFSGVLGAIGPIAIMIIGILLLLKVFK